MPTPAHQMTPEQARSFEHGRSTTNAMILSLTLSCNCVPYEDIFTYRRWQALGYQVQKGEKGHSITTYRTAKKGKDENGDPIIHRFPRTSYVFCRCQVKPKEDTK